MSKFIKFKLQKYTFHLLGVVLVFLLSSCNNLEKIEIGDPKDFKILGFEENYLKISAVIPINNPSSCAVTIKEIDVRVHVNGNYIGKLIVDNNIKIKRRKNSEYKLPVKIRLSNVLGAAFVMMNMKQGQHVEIRLEGHIKAQSMMVVRDFPINETKRIVL